MITISFEGVIVDVYTTKYCICVNNVNNYLFCNIIAIHNHI